MSGLYTLLTSPLTLYTCYNQVRLLTKTTAAQKEVALNYHRVRGLYFLAVVFVATVVDMFTASHVTKELNIWSKSESYCTHTTLE